MQFLNIKWQWHSFCFCAPPRWIKSTEIKLWLKCRHSFSDFNIFKLKPFKSQSPHVHTNNWSNFIVNVSHVFAAQTQTVCSPSLKLEICWVESPDGSLCFPGLRALWKWRGNRHHPASQKDPHHNLSTGSAPWMSGKLPKFVNRIPSFSSPTISHLLTQIWSESATLPRQLCA